MLTDRQRLFLTRTIRTINWRIAVDGGEMIEHNGNNVYYRKDGLIQQGNIPQVELDSICEVVNDLFARAGSELQVTNNMGEFLPANKR